MITITPDKNGMSIDIKVNSNFEFSFNELSSAGYLWTYKCDSNIINIEEYYQKSNTEYIGGIVKKIIK